ncbi:MAG: sugar ABC transporter substrate-binding protein, partial [Lachnospiraceae bacterium]|nr:sugar ABC transporter substrate-binding protein [Lachnospiraceae bacterium]
MKKKVLALVLTAAMAFGLTACGGSQAAAPAAAPADAAPAAEEEAPAEDEAPAAEAEAPAAGEAIKVAIINNDPNESGYRTANDRDLKATFCAENGFDASFYYSLKNDEQIQFAQQAIND